MLSPDDLAKCAQAVAMVSAAADAAEAKAQDSDTWWARTVLGSESTVNAMKADAAATRHGYEVLREKLDRWTADPSLADHAAALSFLDAANSFADCSALIASAKQLSASNTVLTVASDTAHDVAQDVAAGATAGLGIYATLALLGLVGWGAFSFLRRRKGGT